MKSICPRRPHRSSSRQAGDLDDASVRPTRLVDHARFVQVFTAAGVFRDDHRDRPFVAGHGDVVNGHVGKAEMLDVGLQHVERLGHRLDRVDLPIGPDGFCAKKRVYMPKLAPRSSAQPPNGNRCGMTAISGSSAGLQNFSSVMDLS